MITLICQSPNLQIFRGRKFSLILRFFHLPRKFYLRKFKLKFITCGAYTSVVVFYSDCLIILSLLQYYKIKRPVFPNPNGPLARVVPSSSIVATNEVVKNVISEATAGTSEGLKGSLKEQGPYVQFNPEEKARIGKRAVEYGVASTVRHFKCTFSDLEMKESSVRTWRNKYLDGLSKRKRAGEEMYVNELSDKKRGRRLMLGEELYKQVQSYVLDLRSNGAVINSSITIAVAQGIVTNYDSNLLSENGDI